jgi:hypothetical protein
MADNFRYDPVSRLIVVNTRDAIIRSIERRLRHMLSATSSSLYDQIILAMALMEWDDPSQENHQLTEMDMQSVATCGGVLPGSHVHVGATTDVAAIVSVEKLLGLGNRKEGINVIRSFTKPPFMKSPKAGSISGVVHPQAPPTGDALVETAPLVCARLLKNRLRSLPSPEGRLESQTRFFATTKSRFQIRGLLVRGIW